MKNSRSSEPSQRQRRANELIRHLIVETLQRGHFHDAALMDAGRITVSEVRCSPDLKNATAYVMSLGGENMEAILPALNDHSRLFQQDINRNSNLKFTPRVKFVRDESFDVAQNIEDLLRDVRKDDSDSSE